MKFVFNSKIAIVLIVSMLYVGPTVYAQEDATIPVKVMYDLKLSNSKTHAKAYLMSKEEAFESNPNLTHRVGIYLSLPVTEENDVKKAYYSEEHQDWKIGASFEFEYDKTQATDFSKKESSNELKNVHTIAIDPGINYKVFEYNRNYDKDKSKTGLASTEIKLNYYLRKQKEGSPALCIPQFYAHYIHEWEESDKVAVVIPGDTTTPSTVKDMIVEKPVKKPLLSLRLACVYVNNKKGFGASTTYSWFGEKDGDRWFDDKETIRIEALKYYFPVYDEEKKYMRIGVGAFWETVTFNDDTDEYRYGAIAQLQFDQVYWKY
jgi:hypothetical protein